MAHATIRSLDEEKAHAMALHLLLDVGKSCQMLHTVQTSFCLQIILQK